MADRYTAFAELVQERLALENSVAQSNRRGDSWFNSREDQVAARRRWQAAVEAQATLAQQDQAAAERAVISMLNQMTRLARSATWWPSHANAAIADTVEYATGNDEVSSIAAQRAWDSYWAARSSIGRLARELGTIPDPERQALSERMQQAEEQWLAGWYDWYATHVVEQNGPAAT
jgi:hypothetical protein